MEPTRRSLRVARRLNRLHLWWLVVPWALVDVARLLLPALLGRGRPVDEEQAVRLYRRLSGKDPHVARAEIWRIGMQLRELDERLRDPDEERPGAPRGADPGELDAAAAVLIGFYLAGRRTDDALLAQVEDAWAEHEELFQQLVERASDGSAMEVAVPSRQSRSNCRRRPTATAGLGGAGLTGRPGKTLLAGRVTADAGSRSMKRYPPSVVPAG